MASETDTAGNTGTSSLTFTLDTTAPTVVSVVASGTGITSGSGKLAAGSVVTLTMNLSEAVTVAGGTPTLTLNDGGTASYTGGSGSNALTFSYTVAAGQNTSDLTVTALNLNAATVKDVAGNTANLTGAVTNPAGILQIDTTASVGRAGNTGTSSLTVTLDTTAPVSPSITSEVILNTNQMALTGTAEANSTVKVYDGATLLGSATANGTGAWTYTTAALTDGAHTFIATDTDAAGNTSLASQAVDPVIGSVVTIKSIGSTNLTEVANHYYLYNSSGSGPSLKLGGADVMAGQFGGWVPIGAEQTASGYEVAWKVTGADQYTVWNTNSSGNQISQTDILSGTSVALESLETSFHQDLNGDGVIGVPAAVTIETAGSTSLVEVGSNFFLDSISSGSGPSLKVGGADVVAGQYGAWAPIGAEQTASGYEVAWKVTGSDQYRVWNTDSSGNQISQTDILSGTSVALESLETSFHQDLNGDGVVGVPSHLASAAILNSGSNNPPTIDVSSLANQNTSHILADNPSVSALLASDTFKFYDMPVNDIHNVSISVNSTALGTPIAGAHDTTGNKWCCCLELPCE